MPGRSNRCRVRFPSSSPPDSTMPIQRCDADQAVRYLRRAMELLADRAGSRARLPKNTLELAIARLSSDNLGRPDVAAAITVLGTTARQVTGEVRISVLKARAILIDKKTVIQRVRGKRVE